MEIGDCLTFNLHNGNWWLFRQTQIGDVYKNTRLTKDC